MSEDQSPARCERCGGRVDRPEFFGCPEPHPAPDLAQRIVEAIEDDFTGRAGMGWRGIDEDLRDEIRDQWAALVREELGRAGQAGESS